MKTIAIFALTAFFALSAAAENWHFPLYLDGGQPEPDRISVKVKNSGNLSVEGAELAISAKELGLVNKRKNSIRVVSANNRELLWRIEPDSKKLRKNTKLIVPVDCAAGGETKFFVYYGSKLALELPDYLIGIKSEKDSLEDIDSVADSRWLCKDLDEHHKISIDSKVSRTGKKSLRAEVAPDSAPTWFAAKRHLAVKAGNVSVSVYAKCENAKVATKDGGVGLYIALFGRGKKEQFFFTDRISDTTDWTRLTAKVKIPDGYTRMNIGTMSKISGGTAWFDDFSYAYDDASAEPLTYEVGKRERLSFDVEPVPEKWDVPQDKYDVRALCSVYNFDDVSAKGRLGYFKFKRIAAGNFSQDDFAIFRNGKKVDFMMLGENIVFATGEIAPKTEAQFCVYFKTDRKPQKVATGGTKQSSYVQSDQIADTRSEIDKKAYAKLLFSDGNIMKNPNFENGLDGWYRRNGTTTEAEVVDGGVFGKKSVRVKLPGDEKWYGVQQDVKVSAGKRYLYAMWIKGDTAPLKVPRVRITERKTGNTEYFNAATAEAGKWECVSTIAEVRSENSVLVVNVNESKKCDFLATGALLAEITRAEKFRYETAMDSDPDSKIAAWQINSVIKVFPFFAKPADVKTPKISLAGNEVENLQLAIRSNRDFDGLEISASAPVSADGSKLAAPSTSVAGYVVVDAKSAYLIFSHLKFHETCVPPESLAEVYPDPVIPRKSFDLSANKTESVWLGFSADENAKAGVYKGSVDFKKDGKTVLSVPYEVKVYGFSIPKETHLMAIFDSRGEGSNGSWRPYTPYKGVYSKFYDRSTLQRFMATRRATVDHADPIKFNIKDGKGTADFSKFDAFCKLSFDELKLPMMYLQGVPGHAFALPIPNIGNERPYEGEWPYSNVKDYSKLRPQYRAALAARVKLIFDHLREKGWENNFIMFLSDEPYTHLKHVEVMLNTYFGAIHETAPEAKIYTSTWGYAKEIEKQVDVWGLSISAASTPAEIAKIDKQGKAKVFTTDGNYCIDTPYNAQERIMAAFCYAGGFLGYEYWGADWYMQNPFKWGMHKDRISSPVPNVRRRNRFPNGDGYFVYSGEIIGRNEIFSSVRFESVRDGQEDYEYFLMLDKLAKKTGDKEAFATLEKVKAYAVYPNPGARNSTEMFPNPDAYTITLRDEIASHIERLLKK